MSAHFFARAVPWIIGTSAKWTENEKLAQRRPYMRRLDPVEWLAIS